MGSPTALRIASFLPAATEMVCQLGLGEYLVGISHECDYPAEEVKGKPVLVDCALNLEGMSMGEIDKAVSAQLRDGKSLYYVNEERLRSAAPTLLITQNLCQVCGPAGNEVTQVLKTLKPGPEILWQTPKSFEGVLLAYEELGRKTGRLEAAQAWVLEARARVKKIAATVEEAQRKRHGDKEGPPPKTRVAFLEWVEPLYCGGHWVPQMLSWAGGADVNSTDCDDSVRMDWQRVLDWKPEVVIVAPCGFKTDKALEQAKLVTQRPGFETLPAAQSGRVFAVDANSYYARPGPRLVEGVELMAHLIDPQAWPWEGPQDAFAKVEF